jgi:uracil-DNA glycosylase family 4
MDPRQLGCLCDTCPLKNSIPVFPQAPFRCKLAIVGEAPGPDEEVFGDYFVGPSGDFLDDMLRHLGMDRNQHHITNACMCRPRFKMSPEQWRKAIACCEPRLKVELAATGAKTMLAFGGKALYALTGPVMSDNTKAAHKKLPSIFAWAGAPLPGWKGHYDGLTVLATLHPAFCLREKGWAYKPSTYIHTQRAWALARKLLPDWEWPPIHIEVNDATLRALRTIRKRGGLVGSDVETRGTNPLRDLCMCIGLANAEVAVCVPWESYTAGRYGSVQGIDSCTLGTRIRDEVVGILEDKSIPLAFQNGPHDLLTFQRLGIKARGYTWDTLPAHTIVASGRRHDLGWIMCEESHAPRWKEEKHTASNEKGAKKFSKRSPPQLREYCAKDSHAPVWLREPLGQRLDEEHNGWQLYDSYLTNMQVAMKMQTFGFPANRERMMEHRRLLGKRKSRAKQELRLVARKYWPAWGRTFNPASQAHLRKLVFDKLRVRPTKWSQLTEEPSLDKSVLAELKTHDNPLVVVMARGLDRYRQYAKLRDTYCDPIKLIDSRTGRVHVTWRVTGARTFRWSASPNLMNIPLPVIDRRLNRKTGEVVEVIRVAGLRDMYIPPSRKGWIVRGDYDQLEIKIVALLSGCQLLLEWFEQKKDVHRMVAMIIFPYRKDPGEVTGGERNVTKPVEYGWCYGADPRTMQQTLVNDGFAETTLAQCIRFDEALTEALHEIPTWHDGLIRTAYRERYIEAPISGHRLPIYQRVKPTECYNLPVQHSAADLINPVVKPISDALNWETEGILAQVHDELVLGGEDPVKLAKLLVKHMEKNVTLGGNTAKFTIGLKIGKNWADCVSVDRSLPLEKGVAKAIREVRKKEREKRCQATKK